MRAAMPLLFATTRRVDAIFADEAERHAQHMPRLCHEFTLLMPRAMSFAIYARHLSRYVAECLPRLFFFFFCCLRRLLP